MSGRGVIGRLPWTTMLLALVGCGSTQVVERPGPPPPVIMDTAVWTLFRRFDGPGDRALGEESSSYFNWTTLYRATNGYDYGVWRRRVFDQPRAFADSYLGRGAGRGAVVRYVNVRMMDSLIEVQCASQAMIERASALRYSDGTVLPPFGAPLREVTYAVPGTFGADIVGAICARGRRLFP